MKAEARTSLRRPISAEFEGAELGDPRRTRRLQAVATRAAAAPEAGFPQMVGDDSELEALYRFLSNERIGADAILAPHIAATTERAREAGTVLVVHDTTDFRFGGLEHREGLGPTHGNQEGFLGHFALAVKPGEARVPLGVIGLLRIARKERKKTRKKSWYEMSKDPQRESLRWGELVEQVEKRRKSFDCIHLMDREGDVYDLLATMVKAGTRFVVRGAHDRALADDAGLLHGALETLQPMARRTISLSVRPDSTRRDAKAKRKHPPRSGRSADIALSSTPVSLRRTQGAHVEDEQIDLNVVHVWEPSPPAGEPGVSWVLYTTEAVDTAEDILAVVDHYRARWTIEEFFKALKTGCNIERRQLETFHGLSNALSVFIPIAWKMLLARSVARAAPTASARTILSSEQLKLLKERLKLPVLPKTAEEALLAVAKLGGHLKRNGAPGWQTIGRGFEALLWMQIGWRTALRTSDQ